MSFEEICNTVLSKINTLKNIINVSKLVELESKFMLSAAQCYYKNPNAFMLDLNLNKIIYELDELFIEQKSNKLAKKFLTSYPQQSISNKIINYCECGAEIDKNVCKCGVIHELLCEETPFNNKHKNVKGGKNIHYKKWIQRILAQELEKEIPNFEETVLKMKALVKKNNLIAKLININNIRDMLRDLDLTRYNDHCALFLVKVAGIPPPNVPERYINEADSIFTSVVEISNVIRNDNKSNQGYYPYYIMKIFDCILPENNYEWRRILYFIHVQRKETIETNDIEWEQICAILKHPKIKYRPTERDFNLKYNILN